MTTTHDLQMSLAIVVII